MALQASQVLDEDEASVSDSEDDLNYFETFKQQAATQIMEEGKGTRERKPLINMSKLTEQLTKIIRKNVDLLPDSEIECKERFPSADA